jgi:hypothetical protein
MTRFGRILPLAACFAVAAAPALAEGPAVDKVVMVSLGFNKQMPMGTAGAEATRKSLEEARRGVYEVAASECKIILETIGATCALEGLNVQAGVQAYQPSAQMVNVSGNATYKVGLARR